MVKDAYLAWCAAVFGGQVEAPMIATAVGKERNPSASPPFGIVEIRADHTVQQVFAAVIQPTSTDADLQQFVGAWHAQFKGKTFLTIKLEKQQGKLTGTASHADVQLDKASLQAQKSKMVATLSWKPS